MTFRLSTLVALLAAAASPAMGFCGSRTHLAARAAEGEAVEVKNFGYFGELGPFNWAMLDSGANSLCATGTKQSPINMVEGQFNVMSAKEIALTIPDFPEGITFENLGTTVEGITEGSGAKITVAGTEFEMKQFHFHYPSEHIDNGTTMPMEMHMVFQSAEEKIAVVGVYIDLDMGSSAPAPASASASPVPHAPSFRRKVQMMPHAAANDSKPVTSSMLETLFSSIEEIAAPGTKTTTKPLIMSELVQAISSGQLEAYSGSLTTPPCTEGVSWMVATQKVKVAPSTFESVRNVVKFNSRFAQGTLGQPNILSLGATAVAESIKPKNNTSIRGRRV